MKPREVESLDLCGFPLSSEPLGPLLSGTCLSEAEGGGEPGPLWVSSVIQQLSPWGSGAAVAELGCLAAGHLF